MLCNSATTAVLRVLWCSNKPETLLGCVLFIRVGWWVQQRQGIMSSSRATLQILECTRWWAHLYVIASDSSSQGWTVLTACVCHSSTLPVPFTCDTPSGM